MLTKTNPVLFKMCLLDNVWRQASLSPERFYVLFERERLWEVPRFKFTTSLSWPLFLKAFCAAGDVGLLLPVQPCESLASSTVIPVHTHCSAVYIAVCNGVPIQSADPVIPPPRTMFYKVTLLPWRSLFCESHVTKLHNMLHFVVNISANKAYNIHTLLSPSTLIYEETRVSVRHYYLTTKTK